MVGVTVLTSVIDSPGQSLFICCVVENNNNIVILIPAALSVEGETLSLTKVTRSEMGTYLCIASNGVPPSVSKRMKLQIHCKSLDC